MMARDTVDLVAQPPGMIIADGQLVVKKTRCESQLFGVSKASYVSWDTVMITRSLSIYVSIYLTI